jgi:cytoskeletal protein RodZ
MPKTTSTYWCKLFSLNSIFRVMKKLFVLAALLTVGALSANAQTTTTTRQTTTMPATTNPDQTVTPATTTTTESTTTNNDQTMAVPAKTKKGRTVIVPADGAKVKGNGKKIKVK